MTEFNPFFEVRRERLQSVDTGKTLKNKYVLFNDETDEELGIVSDNYNIVTNRMVMDVFEDVVGKYNVAVVKDHRNASSSRWRRDIIFNDDAFTFDMGNGDASNLMISLFNGYSGKVAFGFEVSAVRLICTNGMYANKRNEVTHKFIHYNKNGEIAQELFGQSVETFKESVNIWQNWAQIPYDKHQYKGFINGLDYVTDKSKEILIDYYDTTHNLYKDQETLWGAYSTLTAFQTHESKVKKGSKSSYVFSNKFSQLDKVMSDFYKEYGERKSDNKNLKLIR